MSGIDEIRARCDKATPGPWTWEGDILLTSASEYLVLKPFYDDDKNEISTCVMPYNAEFIGHSREDIPFLLAEIGRLTAENEQLKLSTEICQATWLECIRCSPGACGSRGRVTDLRDTFMRTVRENERLKTMNTQCAEELLKVKAERDAAIEDLKLGVDGIAGCPLCKRMMVSCGKGCSFEWRGIREGAAQ